MNEITYKDYWEQVAALAKDIREMGGDEYDNAHKVVDGREWIIYTWANIEVLKTLEERQCVLRRLRQTRNNRLLINRANPRVLCFARGCPRRTVELQMTPEEEQEEIAHCARMGKETTCGCCYSKEENAEYIREDRAELRATFLERLATVKAERDALLARQATAIRILDGLGEHLRTTTENEVLKLLRST